MTAALFLILATLGLAAALGTVLARNLVHAALHLVAFFFLVACLFVLLEAEFLAAVQVLVYIGAVTILLVFGIMLTRDVQRDETTLAPWSTALPAAFVAGGFLAILVAGIARESGLNGRIPWREARARPAADPAPDAPRSPQGRAIADMPRAVGDELMGRYAVPFEVAALLLTAALVGSIALARQAGDAAAPDHHSPEGRASLRRGIRRRHRPPDRTPEKTEGVAP